MVNNNPKGREYIVNNKDIIIIKSTSGLPNANDFLNTLDTTIAIAKLVNKLHKPCE